MEFPVVHLGQTVGRCTVEDQGLYWQIDCQCQILSDRVERLYCGSRRLGVLEKEGERLCLRRRVSKASVPELHSAAEVLGLSPQPMWEGLLLGRPVCCRKEGDTLLFPYRREAPCPFEELICFFEVRDGYWCLNVRPEWIASIGDDTSGA